MKKRVMLAGIALLGVLLGAYAIAQPLKASTGVNPAVTDPASVDRGTKLGRFGGANLSSPGVGKGYETPAEVGSRLSRRSNPGDAIKALSPAQRQKMRELLADPQNRDKMVRVAVGTDGEVKITLMPQTDTARPSPQNDARYPQW